jgi:predicted nucleic acid-binding protein
LYASRSVGPIRQHDAGRKATFEGHFRTLTRLALRKGVFDFAAALRGRHRLNTPDAIHAAAAITCSEFRTNEWRLAPIEDRITIRVLP